MPKVNNLPIDTNIVAGDKILVTDQNNGAATKLMTLDQFAVYLAKTGGADSGRDAYIYTIKNSITGDGEAEILTNNVAASNLTQITVSRLDSNGVDRYDLFDFIETSTIKISVVDTIKDSNYGVYTLNSIGLVGDDKIRLILGHEHGPSISRFAIGNTIAITPIAHGGEIDVNVTQIRHGAGTPARALGNDGDFYIDTTDLQLFGPKTNELWGDGVDLVAVPGVGNISTSTLTPGSQASVTITKNGPNYDFIFRIPEGEKGEQGDQGVGISSISGDDPGEGNEVTVTVTLNDPSGDTSPANQTFTVPSGEQGFQGIGVDTITADTVEPGQDTTVTVNLKDPSGETTPSSQSFTVPSGAPAEDPNISVTATSVPVDDDGVSQDPTASVSGEYPAVDISLGIPTGSTGAAATIEVGTTTTGDAGTDASVTNSGTNSEATFDFTIPKGDKGETGDDGKTILNGTSAPTSTDGVDGDFFLDTSSHTFYGPKTNGAWGSGTELTSAINIEEGSTTISNISALKVVGQNITLEADDDDSSIAVLTFSGGGGGISTPTLSLARSGFDSDSFDGSQNVTFTPTISANGNTIDKVVYTANNSGFSEQEVTSSPYTLSSQAVSFSTYNGSVTVTATLHYTPPGEDAKSDVTATTTMTLSKSLPGTQAFITGSTGFNFTPAGREVETFDSGTFTTRASFTGTLNDWNLTADSEAFDPTAADGGSWVISSTESDLRLDVTADFTENSDGTGEALTDRTVNTSADHYSRIRSIRYGATSSKFSSTDIENLSLSRWDNDLDFRNTSPDGDTLTTSRANGEMFYIMYNGSLGDITNITDGNNNNVTDIFVKEATNVSGMKVYYSATGAAASNQEFTITL